jgi:glycosyltransferase involved in cell wall biosynthesis
VRLFLTCPTFAAHGGIRVILEWANRLSRRGHLVYLRADDRRGCGWFAIDPSVRIEHTDRMLARCDALVVTSPHAVDYLSRAEAPARRFAFMQMAEHLFRPRDRRWQRQCQAFYLTPAPLLLISRWNWDMVRQAGRRSPVHYLSNAVNLDDFPLETTAKDGRTVLVEGWLPDNPTKDWNRIAAKVASRLARDGYRVTAYGRHPLPPEDRYRSVPARYVAQPTLEQLNALYRDATILVKASHCDARACAPMEAMTKGTVTARAIDYGDDDLVHEVNCLRCPYDEKALYLAALRLLQNVSLREQLAERGRAHVADATWDDILDQVEGILGAGAPLLEMSA